MEQRAETERFNLLAYCMEFVACRFILVVWVVWSLSLVVSLWFGSLWFGSVVRLIGSDF